MITDAPDAGSPTRGLCALGCDGALVDIKVIPRAGSTALAGTRDGAVLIRLAAAPVDGAANVELVALLSRVLAIPKRRIAVISG